MNSDELIFKSQKYIEKHLEEKISVADIANEFGYSEYYFSRMFSECVGKSVMEYVKRRRLMQAAEDILSGMKIIDAAIKFSYDSHSGFTKAFKKEFGYSPSLIRAIQMQMYDLKGGDHMSRLFIRQIDEHESKEELFNILLECISNNQITLDSSNIRKAFEISKKAYEGIKRYSGDEYITHSLNVAIILAEIGADENTIIAGIMCDILVKTNIDINEIQESLPSFSAVILKDVSNFNVDNDLEKDDIVLVKLAQRLHNMRTLEFMDEDRWKTKAKETIEIYMPMARKLGNSAMMEEINKLAIKYV